MYVDLVGNEDTVQVTFHYMFKGAEVDNDVQVGNTVYGGGEVTVSSSRAADVNFKAASGQTTVSFGDADKDVYIDLVGNTSSIKIIFRYIYNGAVIVSDEQSVTLTYGEDDKTVTSTVLVPAGYYLLESAPMATVTYAMALEMGEAGVYEVEVPLGIISTGGTTAPQIPLGPGTPQTIPLGLGIPSTGDAAGMRVLLMACGAALIAFIAIRARRSSSK